MIHNPSVDMIGIFLVGHVKSYGNIRDAVMRCERCDTNCGSHLAKRCSLFRRGGLKTIQIRHRIYVHVESHSYCLSLVVFLWFRSPIRVPPWCGHLDREHAWNTAKKLDAKFQRWAFWPPPFACK